MPAEKTEEKTGGQEEWKKSGRFGAKVPAGESESTEARKPESKPAEAPPAPAPAVSSAPLPAEPSAPAARKPEEGKWTAEKHIVRADEFYAERSWHKALEHYSAAYSLDPNNKRAREGIIKSAKQLGILYPVEGAGESGTPGTPSAAAPPPAGSQGADAQPNMLDVSSVANNYAVYMIQNGQYAEALHWLDKAISENPNVAVYYRNRAVANYYLGNTLQAVYDAKEAMDRGDPRARDLLLSMRQLLKSQVPEQSK